MITQKKTISWLLNCRNFIANGAFSAFVGNTTAYIFAAPILLWWGMPQSSVSILGNVIFAPVLSIFILLCTFVLGASLFESIPSFFSTPLEHITSLWMKCLALGSNHFLYGQQAHPVIVVCLLIVVAATGWGILKAANKKQLAIALLLGHVATTALLLMPLTTPQSSLENRFGKLTVTQKNSSCVTVTDNGYFAGLQSPEKNVQFQVKRHLMQQHGTLKIAHLNLQKLNGRTLRSVNELMTVTHIGKITLPRIDSNTVTPRTPYFWRQLSWLRKKARNYGTFIKYQNYAQPLQNHPQQLQDPVA